MTEEKSHSVTIESFGPREELLKGLEAKGMDDRENPMEPIDAASWTLKRFMRGHPSYGRDSLQDWPNPFWSIAPSRDKTPYEKAKKSIQTAILTHKVIRYRGIFLKNVENKSLS